MFDVGNGKGIMHEELKLYGADLFWSGLSFGCLTINSQSVNYSAIAFIHTILAIAH